MSWEGAAKWVVGINVGRGRRSGLLGSTVKRMMFVHARLMKFDRVLLIGRYRRRHEKYDTKKRCNTRTSQEVTHPSTTLAQARLTAEFDGIRCISAWYDRTCQVLRDQWLYGFDEHTRLTCDA
ncbi:unnamed protein product [Sphenostylis stenocarpa]|uniref:Uncharacterized protein n=1 Tax=Sphenostylis stenocarpa TaxID=92480 RepID=A0AA86S6I7_9FABA|nr:unnamed protein product [Sphenostylis stenocarpa]